MRAIALPLALEVVEPDHQFRCIGRFASVLGLTEELELSSRGRCSRMLMLREGLLDDSSALSSLPRPWEEPGSVDLTLALLRADGGVMVRVAFEAGVLLSSRADAEGRAQELALLGDWTPIEARILEIFRHWGRRWPAQPGRWRELRPAARQDWLDAVRIRWCSPGQQRATDCSGETYIILGNWIQSKADLFLALGESINGPLGYFGGGLDGLNDCLCGGFGAIPPFTLIWQDAARARSLLPGYFEQIIEIFEEHRVEVRLR